MSETSRTNDSAPSLSSYPPAFVSLITTFIKRAEEAETRAHKALVILKAKDQQVFQLQQRMDVLDKIASRLEDVMIPPLDLPQSPTSSDPSDLIPHHRDVRGPEVMGESYYSPIETLYEKYPLAQQKLNAAVEDGGPTHNCYTRCQHLVDGLERSNSQLRDALTVESEQRVKEHEQYIATLVAVTQAAKQMQSSQNVGNVQTVQRVLQSLQGNDIQKSTLQEIMGAAGDNEVNVSDIKEVNHAMNKDMALINKQELMKTVDVAESIIKSLRARLEEGGNKIKKRKVKTLRSRKVVFLKSSRSSISSYYTPKSSLVFKRGSEQRSFSSFFNILKRKYKKIKLKYARVVENFKETLMHCRKLQEDLVLANKTKQTTLNKVEGCTQTDKVVSSQMPCSDLSERTEKPQASRNVHILQGRLDAAGKVMSRQCKQIQDLQQQLTDSNNAADALKKRLSRAESAAAGKDLLGNASKKQLQDLENRNAALNEETSQLKNTVNRLKQELSRQVDVANRVEKEKQHSVEELEEMKLNLEIKLSSLSSALQQKEEVTDRVTSELESKLRCLREKFVSQVTEARDRLLAADSKIQELYLGIETFLRLLFSLNRSSTPELSPSSQAQAVQLASDILQLAPGQVQNILHSSRLDHYLVNKWLKECNRLVHNKVFAKNLGHFLLDAVLEVKIS